MNGVFARRMQSKIRSPLCPLPRSFASSAFPLEISSLVSSSIFIMDTVNEAMRALKQVALKGKKEKELTEKVDSLTATLRLLVFSFERNPRQKAL